MKTLTTRRGSGIAGLLMFMVAVALAGSAGAILQPGEWYEQLTKPSWNPPNSVFAPVWTTLYIAIAVAGWRVWRVSTGWVAPLQLWLLQLILNSLWSWLFFGIHRPDLAMVDIVLLLVSIVAFIVAARRFDSVAAWLFVPYLLWVAFASSLNFAIWQLNGA